MGQFIQVLTLLIGVMTAQPSEVIHKAAATYDVDPKLLAAVIHQESRGYVWARRWEEAFFRRYVAPKTRKQMIGHIPTKTSFITERRDRAVSWGYCQIMGQTARENGFTGESLGELYDPETNIDLGAKLLRKFLDQSKGDVRLALLKYNGGANKSYPHEVLARIDSGEIDYLLESRGS